MRRRSFVEKNLKGVAMNILKESEITRKEFFEYPNGGFSCKIWVHGQDFHEYGETREKAYTRAVLLAETVLFPEVDLDL